MNSEYKRAWNKVNQVMREEFQAFDRFIDQTTNKFKKHVKDRIEKQPVLRKYTFVSWVQ